MKNNLIILSHRRSGTHMLIDTILNNFNYEKYITIEQILTNHPQFEGVEKIDKQIQGSPKIIKSHLLPDFETVTKDKNQLDYLKQTFEENKIIYIYRNPKDVLVSFYNYQKSYRKDLKDVSFEEFIKNKQHFNGTMDNIDYIQYHVQSWQEVKHKYNILFISYEELKTDYEKTIDKISKFIDKPMPNNIIDVRVSNISAIKKIYYMIKRKLGIKFGIQRTSIKLRKGEINNGGKYFSSELEGYVNSKIGNFYKKLGYKDFN